MNHHSNKTTPLLVSIALALALTPCLLAAEEGKWLVRAVANWNTYSSPTVIPDDDGDIVRVGAEDEFNLGIEAEFRINRRLGIEVGMLYNRPEIRVNIDFADGQRALLATATTFRPVTAGLVFHLTPESKVDLTFTPLIGLAFYDDLHFQFQGEAVTLEVDNDFIQGARIAADIPLGASRWALSFAARYLDTAVDGTDPDGERVTFDLDPIILNAGIGFHF